MEDCSILYVINKYLGYFFIIVSNLIPVFGVIFFGWNSLDALILFILEGIIAGVMSAVKMNFLDEAKLIRPFIPLFIIIFTLLSFFQLIFILFTSQMNIFFNSFDYLQDSLFLGVSMQQQNPSLFNMFSRLEWSNYLYPLAFFLISYALSAVDFFYRKKQGDLSLNDLSITKITFNHFKRVYIAQTAIMAGFIIINFLNLPSLAIAPFVVIKTLFDMSG
jgi:hypothetical protein